MLGRQPRVPLYTLTMARSAADVFGATKHLALAAVEALAQQVVEFPN